MPSCNLAPGLQGKDTGTSFILKEEKKLHQLCQAASLTSCLCVSPSIMGSEVRNIYYAQRDKSKGEVDCCHIFIAIALLYSCGALSCSYLSSVVLWCYKNSLWLSSLQCWWRQFWLIYKALPLGLRTEMWHGWGYFNFYCQIEGSNVVLMYVLCSNENVFLCSSETLLECGFFFAAKKCCLFHYVVWTFRNSVWKSPEDKGLDVLMLLAC